MAYTIRKPSYFFVIAVIGLMAAFIGFFKTFFIPVTSGKFIAPVIIHVHGAFAFGWIFLFVVQASLVHFNKFNVHRVFGFAGLFIAAGVAVTMVPAGMYAVEKELLHGSGDSAYSTLLGVVTSAILFICLVIAGLVNRSRPDFHKRYMLLATIVVLWPAWFRFRHYFPNVPRPEIWFALVLADSLIVFAWLWEKIKYGTIHPVLKFIGPLIIAEQTVEVILYDSTYWRAISKWLYFFFTG